MNTNKIETCVICQDPAPTLLRFQNCEHRICPTCVCREIFTRSLLQIQKEDLLQVPCQKCSLQSESSIATISKQDLAEFLKKKEELESQKSVQNKANNLCQNHPSNYTNQYCVPCSNYVCEKCASTNGNEHFGHRIVPCSKMEKILKSSISKQLRIRYIQKEVFDQMFESMSSHFRQATEEYYNDMIKKINELIEALANIQKEFDANFKTILTKNVLTLSIYKMIFAQYYSDKEKYEESKDINFLRYINNISSEMVSIKVNHSSQIEKKLGEVQNQIISLKDFTKKTIETDFIFEEVPRGFTCESFLTSHGSFVSSIIETKDNKLVAGSESYSISVYEQQSDSIYELVDNITKLTGKVVSIIELRDSRILTAGSDSGVLKIWVQSQKGYKLQSSLNVHEKPSTSLLELRTGKIVSGHVDGYIVIYRPKGDNFEKDQIILNIANAITVLSSLNSGGFAVGCANANIYLFNDRKNEEAPGFQITSTISIGINSPKIPLTICELFDGRICNAGKSNAIYLWKEDENENDKFVLSFRKDDAHESYINTVIQLRDGRVASASTDRTIKIWGFDNDNKNKRGKGIILLSTLCEYGHGMYKLLELQDSRLVSTCSDKTIIVWRERNDMY